MLEKVKDYHVVKKPMDFGTMRAKAVEGKYGSLTEFKVYKNISKLWKYIFSKLFILSFISIILI